MKKRLMNGLLIICIIGFTNVSAQDLIVTKKNDSINAQITKTKKEFTYFRFVKDGEVRSTLLSKYDIKELKKGFYATSDIPEEYIKKTKKDYTPFSFGIQAGYGYMVGRVSNDYDKVVRDHYMALKSGINFTTNFHYFFSESIGLGLKHSSFFSSNAEENISTTFNDNPNVQEIGLKNDIYVNYLGLSLANRFKFGDEERHQLFMGFGLGYVNYKNKEQAGTRFINSKGETLGVNYDFGYNYKLNKNILLSIELSYLMGNIRELEVEENGETTVVELNEDNIQSLHRVNISAGLRFELN